MDVLVYANPKDPAKERFLYAVTRAPSLSPIFALEQKRLMALLKNSTRAWRAIVFFIRGKDDLLLAISLKAYFRDGLVIVLLPEWNGMHLRMGLSLSPSLITKANGDFSDVVAVLEKISTNAQ